MSLPPRPTRRRCSADRRFRSSSSTSTRRRSRRCRASSATTSPAGRSPLGISWISGTRAIAFIGDAVADPFGFTSSRDRRAGLDAMSSPRPGVEHPADVDRAWRARSLRGPRTGASDARPATGGRRRSSPPAIRRHSASSPPRSEIGLHVPDDLSVIGYDDIEAADYVGLTTIRQQLFESGRRGAEILLAEIEQPIRASRPSPAGTQSWWSARPRRLRRRAVDEGRGASRDRHTPRTA